MNEIVKPEDNPNVFTKALEQAIENGITGDVIQSLIDANERILKGQAEIDFNCAMARLQPELPAIKKTAKGHNTKYAKYEHIDREIRPLYTKEGFSLSFTTKRDGENETYYGTLKHVSGHSITAEITLPADTSGSKNAIQAKGSTSSYARRYLITMLFNIVTEDEDDDGRAGGLKPITEQQAEKLKTLIRESGADTKGFLEMFGANSVDEIAESDFKKAHVLLVQQKELKGKQSA